MIVQLFYQFRASLIWILAAGEQQNMFIERDETINFMSSSQTFSFHLLESLSPSLLYLFPSIPPSTPSLSPELVAIRRITCLLLSSSLQDPVVSLSEFCSASFHSESEQACYCCDILTAKLKSILFPMRVVVRFRWAGRVPGYTCWACQQDAESLWLASVVLFADDWMNSFHGVSLPF